MSDLELPPDGSVSHGDDEGLLGDVGSISDHGSSSLEESSVGQLSERRLLDFTIAGDLHAA